MNPPSNAFSRRGFLGGMGAGLLTGASLAQSMADGQAGFEKPYPKGKPLRVAPVLVYHVETPRELTSWRSYGGVTDMAAIEAEAARIGLDLTELAGRSDFPLEFKPVKLIANETQAAEAAAADADAILIHAWGGWQPLYAALAGSGKPCVMFIRHKTEPYYLYHEIAHWRFLRRNGDTMAEPNMDTGDIAVDDLDEVHWRLRALYGLKNAKGTKMLAIGSLAAYSEPAQLLGPAHAREVWDYAIEIVPRDEYARRLAAAKADGKARAETERETAAFLNRPGITLKTKREYVFNSFMAMRVCRDLLEETGASNFGFDLCMGREVIEMLGTPPCLVLALANDEGYTAYCHTDLSHTCPGVLLRWIANRPAFVCNTHFPHEGLFTVAHCAAPTRMNGRDYEPAAVMTHYESDTGAATKVEYPKGQTVTAVIPNLHCTRWHGFKGAIVDSPNLPVCRSQMDIRVEGDWKRLTREMEGFHAQVVYGDYLRETGYALKKLGLIEWKNYSETV